MVEGTAPPQVRELAERRAVAREAGDFATADDLRDRIAEAGWTVVDEPGGWRLQPSPPSAPAGPRRAADIASVLQEPPTADLSVHWVVEGWPDDVARGIASFRAHLGGRRVHHVVADVTGAGEGAFGDRRGGRGVGARHRLGRRLQRRPHTRRRRRRLRHGRLHRGDGRRVRPAGGGVAGSGGGPGGTVRDRHARPAPVRGRAGAGGLRRRRGLPHGHAP